MIGAIAGDVIGSVFESQPIKTKQFHLFIEDSRFTDDTVLTVAVADAILNRTERVAQRPRARTRTVAGVHVDRGLGLGNRG